MAVTWKPCALFWTSYETSGSDLGYHLWISSDFLVSPLSLLLWTSEAHISPRLVGIVYKTWVTPVKGKPGVFNTRTGLGGFSDRVGALAYALTPLTVALGSRESILTMFTGIPYQNFNFLHRWTGRIIFAQAVLHTIGWCVIEGKLYQPQPTVWRTFIKQLYMIWGVVAMVLMLFLFVFSLTPVIKRTGHEFFRKTHYIVAMVYIGACWGHWAQLYCWMLASLIVWGLDRGVRLLRTLLIHTRQIDGSTGKSNFFLLSHTWTNKSS